MLMKTSARRVISQPILSPLTGAVQHDMQAWHCPLQLEDLPDFYDIFPAFSGKQSDSPSVASYPESSQPSSPDDIVLYMHSSGSTGLPKPIPQTQLILAEYGRSCTCRILLDLHP